MVNKVVVNKLDWKIDWQKAGRVAAPGRYLYTFGWLTVTAEDLAVWRHYPQAQFTLMPIPTGPDEADEYHLGTFELPTGS